MIDQPSPKKVTVAPDVNDSSHDGVRPEDVETAEDLQGDRVSIVEKVRFWEQQDRINQALIPRFLETHDLVVSIAEQLANFNERLTSCEATALSRTADLLERASADLKQELDAKVSSLNHKVSTVDQSVTVLLKESKTALGAIDQLSRELNKLRASITSTFALYESSKLSAETRIATLETSNSMLATIQSAEEATINTHSESLKNLTDTVGDLESQLDDFDAALRQTLLGVKWCFGFAVLSIIFTSITIAIAHLR